MDLSKDQEKENTMEKSVDDGERQDETTVTELEKFLGIGDAGKIPEGLLRKLAKEKIAREREIGKILARSLAKHRPSSLEELLRRRAK